MPAICTIHRYLNTQTIILNCWTLKSIIETSSNTLRSRRAEQPPPLKFTWITTIAYSISHFLARTAHFSTSISTTTHPFPYTAQPVLCHALLYVGLTTHITYTSTLWVTKSDTWLSVERERQSQCAMCDVYLSNKLAVIYATFKLFAWR